MCCSCGGSTVSDFSFVSHHGHQPSCPQCCFPQLASQEVSAMFVAAPILEPAVWSTAVHFAGSYEWQKWRMKHSCSWVSTMEKVTAVLTQLDHFPDIRGHRRCIRSKIATPCCSWCWLRRYLTPCQNGTRDVSPLSHSSAFLPWWLCQYFRPKNRSLKSSK